MLLICRSLGIRWAREVTSNQVQRNSSSRIPFDIAPQVTEQQLSSRCRSAKSEDHTPCRVRATRLEAVPVLGRSVNDVNLKSSQLFVFTLLAGFKGLWKLAAANSMGGPKATFRPSLRALSANFSMESNRKYIHWVS